MRAGWLRKERSARPVEGHTVPGIQRAVERLAPYSIEAHAPQLMQHHGANRIRHSSELPVNGIW